MPTPTTVPSASPRPRTERPTATPTPLPPPGWWVSDSAYPSVQEPYPSFPPAGALEDEIREALETFHRVRAEVEETLNPDLLYQVCVEPYLSQKLARLRTNQQDGSYWKTVTADFTIQWFTQEGNYTVRAWVRKWETKLFYPRGAALPDDETCAGTIYSYRNCAYDVEYRLLQSGGRWYVSEALPQGDCPTACQQGLPTATPAPTPTPTTTPRPAPTMSFPPQAVVPDARPPLPADLYFLRDYRLWRWPAAGGSLVQIRSPDAIGAKVLTYSFSPADSALAYLTVDARLYVLDRRTGEQRFPFAGSAAVVVHTYGFSADGGSLLYVTTAGELHVADLAAGRDVVVPTVGHPAQFALAGEGRYLVYLSTDEVPAESGPLYPPADLGLGYAARGTLLAVDLESAEQPYDLGFCGPAEGEEAYQGCSGFLLAPDGRQAVFTDDRGVWAVEIPRGVPRQLATHRSAERHYGARWCGTRTPLAWFPDGERLLEYVGCEAGGGLAVLSAGNALEQGLPHSECFGDCHVEWTWSPDALWVSPIPGTLYAVRTSAEGFLHIAATPLDTETRRLWPTQVQGLPDGRVLFAHQRCAAVSGADETGPAPGVYLLQADGAVRWIWPLPDFPCETTTMLKHQTYPGTVVWTADGAAFLYLDAMREPLLLGLTDGSALWDVRGWLRGALAPQWEP